jgi:hypothetical protein
VAHPLLAIVRDRFDQCCGYCGVSETDVGSELTVDHFRPISRGGDEALENLLYACSACNAFKADFYPSSAELTAGIRLLHPLLDDLGIHLSQLSSSGRLEPLTITGKFHINVLQLNRRPLVVHRVRKAILADVLKGQAYFTGENDELEGAIRFARSYLAYLKEMRSSRK